MLFLRITRLRRVIDAAVAGSSMPGGHGGESSGIGRWRVATPGHVLIRAYEREVGSIELPQIRVVRDFRDAEWHSRVVSCDPKGVNLRAVTGLRDEESKLWT